MILCEVIYEITFCNLTIDLIMYYTVLQLHYPQTLSCLFEKEKKLFVFA